MKNFIYFSFLFLFGFIFCDLSVVNALDIDVSCHDSMVLPIHIEDSYSSTVSYGSSNPYYSFNGSTYSIYSDGDINWILFTALDSYDNKNYYYWFGTFAHAQRVVGNNTYKWDSLESNFYYLYNSNTDSYMINVVPNIVNNQRVFFTLSLRASYTPNIGTSVPSIELLPHDNGYFTHYYYTSDINNPSINHKLSNIKIIASNVNIYADSSLKVVYFYANAYSCPSDPPDDPIIPVDPDSPSSIGNALSKVSSTLINSIKFITNKVFDNDILIVPFSIFLILCAVYIFKVIFRW